MGRPRRTRARRLRHRRLRYRAAHPRRTPLLRAAVGDKAEQLVHRYAACLRKATWRPLAQTRQLHDRFDGTVYTLTAAELRPWSI
ncbi:hypothetical protein ACFQZ4_52350 [Catellatospora coxensis]